MANFVNAKGVDISYWNGDIDLSKVKKAGYNFVMIRCGWGNNSTSNDDSQFSANVAKAEKLGMPWGVYLFSYACSTSDAKSELAHIDRLLKEQKAKGHLPTMPIAIDIEPNDTVQNNGGWNSSNLTNVATIVLDGLRNLGYYPMIYTGYDELAMMSNHIKNDYDCWFAQWYTKPSSYKYNRLGIWQYGGETNYINSPTISGVGVIDQNICYKDYPTIIKNGGYNGWKVPEAELKLSCNKVHTYAWCQYAFGVSGATNPKWTTSNTQISSIDQYGVLSTHAAGTTTVTCTDGKKSISVPVDIDPGKQTGISTSKLVLAKGQSAQLTAREKDVSWFSSNKKVATVSPTGKIISIGKGFTTISAYNKTGASTCLVYVEDKIYPSTINENDLRKKVVNTINEWIGTKEGSKNYEAILKIFNNSINIDRVIKKDDGWCAATVSTAWLKLGIAQYICYGFNCDLMKAQAIAKGIWVERDNYTPKIGDAILYDWQDDGIGDNTGTIEHIGMVTSVGKNSFIVTEGNYDKQVKTRIMNINGRYIRGFITPNYAYIAKNSSQSITTPFVSSQGVANGKWLKVINNGSTYNGILGKALTGFALKVNKGTIQYSAHIKNGNWLGNVTGFNYKDYNNGYAGNGQPAEKGGPIDAIKINYKTPSEIINKYGYYKAAYRVHVLGGAWLNWQYDTETTNGQDGYAGIFGKTIDAIEVKLIKA